MPFMNYADNNCNNAACALSTKMGYYISKKVKSSYNLACVTEQTHEIRFVCMVCVIAQCLLSRIIVHKLITSRKTVHIVSVHLYSLRPTTYTYPNVFFFQVVVKFCCRSNAVLTELCIFAAAAVNTEIYP